MNKSEFKFTTKDNVELTTYKFSNENKPKAILLIVHGMAEHAQRYGRFAERLLQDDIHVYAHDQRGHGKTAGSVENLGFFAENDGWGKVANDVAELVDLIKKENPDVPVFVLGHSMGSFIARTYAINNSSEISGLILSGTAGSAGLLGKVGMLLVKMIIAFKGKRHLSKLMDNMSFGDFGKAFKPNRTKFDWLSRDNDEVDKYINDEYCGTVFSAGFFKDLMQGLEFVNTQSNINKMSKNLPVFFFSGSKDPVSKNATQVKTVFDMFKNAGISDVSMKIYDEARHETLNETNRDEVMENVVKWIKQKYSNNA